MKAKFTDWILRIVFYDESGRRVIDYQILNDATYECALATAEAYSLEGAVVRIYEFKDKV